MTDPKPNRVREIALAVAAECDDPEGTCVGIAERVARRILQEVCKELCEHWGVGGRCAAADLSARFGLDDG